MRGCRHCDPIVVCYYIVHCTPNSPQLCMWFAFLKVASMCIALLPNGSWMFAACVFKVVLSIMIHCAWCFLQECWLWWWSCSAPYTPLTPTGRSQICWWEYNCSLMSLPCAFRTQRIASKNRIRTTQTCLVIILQLCLISTVVFGTWSKKWTELVAWFWLNVLLSIKSHSAVMPLAALVVDVSWPAGSNRVRYCSKCQWVQHCKWSTESFVHVFLCRLGLLSWLHMCIKWWVLLIPHW